MNVVSRNRSAGLLRSRKDDDGYDYRSDKSGEYHDGWKIFSSPSHLAKSCTHRRDQARKRRIFLQTYKLAFMKSGKKIKTRKLKTIAVKVRSVVVSILAFIRRGASRSRSDARVIKCC